MKRRQAAQREELEREEFEAYGEYTYDFLRKAGGSEQAQAAPAPPPLAPARPRKKRGWLFALCLLTVLAVALIVVMETVFRIQAVYVIGNEDFTPQQIVALSGLKRGESIFSIREEDVEAAVSKDCAVVYKGMKKDYPSTIYLYIEERKSVAVMQWLGMQYLLDEEGVVMSEQNDMVLPDGKPVVTGFRVSNAGIGQQLMLRSDNQLEAYQAIMEELRLQLYADQISEVNLANPKRIYLITREGVTAFVGDGEHMRAKVGAVRTYMAYLRQLGKKSGTLDVSVPEDAKYMPDS